MKKFLFLMLSAAVAVSASAGINGAKISKKVAKIEGKSKTEQVARVAKSGVVATPAPKFRTPAKVDIPAGMVAVTLTAVIWDGRYLDGSLFFSSKGIFKECTVEPCAGRTVFPGNLI